MALDFGTHHCGQNHLLVELRRRNSVSDNALLREVNFIRLLSSEEATVVITSHNLCQAGQLSVQVNQLHDACVSARLPFENSGTALTLNLVVTAPSRSLAWRIESATDLPSCDFMDPVFWKPAVGCVA